MVGRRWSIPIAVMPPFAGCLSITAHSRFNPLKTLSVILKVTYLTCWLLCHTWRSSKPTQSLAKYNLIFLQILSNSNNMFSFIAFGGKASASLEIPQECWRPVPLPSPFQAVHWQVPDCCHENNWQCLLLWGSWAAQHQTQKLERAADRWAFHAPRHHHSTRSLPFREIQHRQLSPRQKRSENRRRR